MSAYTRLESDGATATSIFPIGACGKPGSTTRFHVSPPSCETQMPSSSPFVPLNIAHVCISTCQMPANKFLGFFTSSARPEQPEFSLTNSTCFHVLPPSDVLYTPRSSCGPVARPTAHTYTMFGFVGCTTMR